MRTLLESGPVLLASREASRLFEFRVRNEEEKKFLRFIALWRDNESLGGEAPTFEVKAGGGVLTPVRPGQGEVTIASGSQTVGSVVCTREPNDIYLLTVTHDGENTNPWRIRIRNNDPETLRFLGFSSDVENETLQPWMVLDQSRSLFKGEAEQELERKIEVRNWGTKRLKFLEPSGTPLGGEDSPILLETRPEFIDPHQVKTLTLKARNIQRSSSFSHTFACDDPIEEHRKLSFQVTFVDCQPLRDESKRLRDAIAESNRILAEPDIPNDVRAREQEELSRLLARQAGVVRALAECERPVA